MKLGSGGNGHNVRFGLNDHPLGDFYAAGAVALSSLPQIMKSEFERGKKEALGGKADEKRIEDIGKKTPADAGKKAGKSAETLTDQAKATADQMEMTPGQRKIYAKMLGNKKLNTVSVEA